MTAFTHDSELLANGNFAPRVMAVAKPATVGFELICVVARIRRLGAGNDIAPRYNRAMARRKPPDPREGFNPTSPFTIGDQPHVLRAACLRIQAISWRTSRG